jgi:hypothetical protein
MVAARSPWSDALASATQSTFGSSMIVCIVLLTSVRSLKIAAVTSTGLLSEPNDGTNSRSFSIVSGASSESCMPPATISSVIRMPAPPEMVMIASRLPAGSFPQRKARP